MFEYFRLAVVDVQAIYWANEATDDVDEGNYYGTISLCMHNFLLFLTITVPSFP